MNALKDILQRCHKRHEKPLNQRKTVITPAIYKGLDYHFTVYCAHRHPVRLYDLEQAGISFMPTGRTQASVRIPQSFGGERFLRPQRMEDWEGQQWHASWGIQVYTGIPSQRDGAPWHDFDFKYEMIAAAPDAVLACIESLINAVGNPLLTLTQSGGLRFSCRVPHYLHPNTEEARFYIYKDIPIAGDACLRDVYLEILGEAGYSPWDARHEILLGDLLNPPVITKEVLFTPVNALREEFHAPEPLTTARAEPTRQDFIVSTPSLGSNKLDLAKEALLKRGFSYLREADNVHHWYQQVSEDADMDVLLWERNGTVWIRASTSDFGLPMQDTLITDVWDDTGILPPIPATGLPVSEKILAVREGKLSPLAIKRPSPVLQKPEDPQTVYEPLEKNIDQIQSVFESDKRIIGLMVSETGARRNYEVESHLLKGGRVAFSAGFATVEEAVGHFQRKNLPSIARWRKVSFLWNQVKEIPLDERMATPFERGNVCEDPERFLALTGKGVNATEVLCPQCPVYTVCQERGYLAQPVLLQRAKTQVFGFHQKFLDPQELVGLEEIIEPVDGKERLCLVSVGRTGQLFLECGISKERLEEWRVNWQASALGNFAQALLNTLEIESESGNIVTKRIRTVMQAFQQHEAELVRQMGQVNVKGKVVAEGITDEGTGEELAHFTIAFESGVSAYMPLNNNAADRLMVMELPVFRLESFELDKDMRIPMPIEQAIQLGILDMETVEKIQDFPSVYRHPDWTLWHQLKRFFTHYTRDADAPIIWYDKSLNFWVPPAPHPSVQRLLFLSATLTEDDLHRAFPDEEIEVIHMPSTPWLEGNQVFQIRTGVHTRKTILDYDSTWDVIGLSKMGERFFLGICAEIDRDPNVKHAIITHHPIIKQLKEVAEKENVCLLTEFKDLYNLESTFEAAEVVWIVGTPPWEPGVMWRHAQIAFGNDEEPLSYEAEPEFQHYKDERVQRIYTQAVRDEITDTVGRVGLNRWGGKKVVLINSLEIPDITDRPETLLFDWEDFEIAGSLDKLAETIATREQFETELGNLTAESPRIEVERILGCSSRQANRMLNKLRGGNIPRVTFREQILSLLADGEKKRAEIIAAIDGHQEAIHKELTRLTKIGEIEKVRWGVYALKTE